MDLLASKFYYPPHRLDFVQRPQILAVLKAGLRAKLTLVSAPAGFGKTTVVSEWIREGGYPVTKRYGVRDIGDVLHDIPAPDNA